MSTSAPPAEILSPGFERQTTSESISPNKVQGFDFDHSNRAMPVNGLSVCEVELGGSPDDSFTIINNSSNAKIAELNGGRNVPFFQARKILPSGEVIPESFIETGRKDKDGSKIYRLAVGRNMSGQNPFDFSREVSKEHATIDISESNGKIKLVFAETSTNGSKVKGNFESVYDLTPESTDEKNDEGWDYTLLEEDRARLGKLAAYNKRLIEEPSGEVIEIATYSDGGKQYPVIHRDTAIEGGVYIVPGNQEAILVEDKNERGEIKPLYDRPYKQAQMNMKKLLPRRWFTKNIMPHEIDESAVMGVYKAASEALVYDEAHAKVVQENYVDKVVDLTKFLNRGKGVCRHQNLFAAYMLERMVKDKQIDGSVSIDRNRVEGKGGHAWARFTSKEGTVYIVDAAQEFSGTLEQAQQLKEGWDYRRPEEK